jgi:hypothetical protein
MSAANAWLRVRATLAANEGSVRLSTSSIEHGGPGQALLTATRSPRMTFNDRSSPS